MMTERQEIYCHACGKYVQFDIDTSLNGNHILNCPSCGHEHCRVVTDGVITDGRWDSRNNNWGVGATYSVSASTTSTSTVSITYSMAVTASSMTSSWISSSAYTGYGTGS